jgi:hypothetical protein
MVFTIKNPTMYSFKEKNKLYYDLLSVQYAQADINLLCSANPSDPIIERARQNPERYFKDVLSRLLDLKTAEEIRINRRQQNAPKVSRPATSKTAVEKASKPAARKPSVARATKSATTKPAVATDTKPAVQSEKLKDNIPEKKK